MFKYLALKREIARLCSLKLTAIGREMLGLILVDQRLSEISRASS
jgi:hypothetical protein